MENISQSELLEQLRSSMKVLDSLRNEHKAALNELLKGGETNGHLNSPTIESLESFVEKIERAIGDGDVCLNYSTNFSSRNFLLFPITFKMLRLRNKG